MKPNMEGSSDRNRVSQGWRFCRDKIIGIIGLHAPQFDIYILKF